MDEGKSADIVKQFLTFKVGSELNGIEVENVREVIEFSDITLVPKTPDYISGIINLRGEVVPIINLPILFYHQYQHPMYRLSRLEVLHLVFQFHIQKL